MCASRTLRSRERGRLGERPETGWLRSITLAAAFLSSAAIALEPSLQAGTVLEAAQRLQAGEYLWAPAVAPQGPVLVVVSLATQRAVVYRNGIPIGISTVSTGREGFETPTGIFTILQKQIEHFSNLYDDAPMPYMQRLTWGGVALHAGNLPGYAASHGCIRLPREFARLLYGVTQRGMTVVVTDRPTVPHVAPAEALLGGRQALAGPSGESASWHPDRSPSGPISIVVSAADRRAVVLRNGIVIGSAPVAIEGGISRTSAYVLGSVAGGQAQWLRIALPGQSAEDDLRPLRGRIIVADSFRRSVESVLVPGATVVVTGDTLSAGGTGRSVTVIQDDPAPEPPAGTPH